VEHFAQCTIDDRKRLGECVHLSGFSHVFLLS
jgi:hypothetical protein